MDQVKLRRYQNLLIVSGSGVIIFGIWSVLKAVMLVLSNTQMLTVSTEELPDGMIYRVIFYGIFIGFLIFVIVFRLIIGLSARSVGFGKKNRWFYLILAFGLLFVDLFMVIYEVVIFFTEFLIDTAVAVIVDATSTYTVIELIIASFKVKKLTKAMKQG